MLRSANRSAALPFAAGSVSRMDVIEAAGSGGYWSRGESELVGRESWGFVGHRILGQNVRKFGEIILPKEARAEILDRFAKLVEIVLSDHDDGRAGFGGSNRAAHFESVDRRHLDVGDHQFRVIVPEVLDRLLSVLCFDHFRDEWGAEGSDQSAHARVVVGDQDARAVLHSAPKLPRLSGVRYRGDYGFSYVFYLPDTRSGSGR